MKETLLFSISMHWTKSKSLNNMISYTVTIAREIEVKPHCWHDNTLLERGCTQNAVPNRDRRVLF